MQMDFVPWGGIPNTTPPCHFTAEQFEAHRTPPCQVLGVGVGSGGRNNGID
jgi:hypothetical protein